MNKLKKNNVVSFPSKLSDVDKEIEAIVFAAAEPLNIETIENKIAAKEINNPTYKMSLNGEPTEINPLTAVLIKLL